MSEWISVIDKHLPENVQLIFCRNGWAVEQGFFQDGIVYTYGCRRLEKEIIELEPVMLDRITHWMLLPSPPVKDNG